MTLYVLVYVLVLTFAATSTPLCSLVARDADSATLSAANFCMMNFSPPAVLYEASREAS